MKRLHVHVAVSDIPQSIGFYSALFAAQPAVVKPDYAKWMLDDPRVNFAISSRGREPGLDHLGIQVEDAGELGEVYARLREAGGNVIDQGQTSCCYAKSEKSWIDDPAGLCWETFPPSGESRNYEAATGPAGISWESFLPSGESTDYGDRAGERGTRGAHERGYCAPHSSRSVPWLE